jgi:O-antigen/teichoic acid export membrane protein
MRRAIIHSFNNELLRKLIAVISAALIARALGPSGKGQYALLIYFAAISVSFVSVGLANAQLFLKRKYTLEKVTSNILFVSLILGLTAFVIMNLLVEFALQNIYKDVSKHLVFLTTIAIPFRLVTLSMKRVLQSEFKIKSYNYLKMIEPVVFLFLLISSYLLINININHIVIIFVLSGIINFLVTVLYIRNKVIFRIAHIKFDVLKSIGHYVIRVGPGGLLGLFQYRIDVFIIAYFLNDYSVGLYVAGMAVAEIVWRVPAAIVNVLQPKIANGSDDEAKLVTPQAFRLTLLVVAFLCAGIGLFNTEILLILYGVDFIEAEMVLRIILPGILFISLWKILLNDLNARGFPQYYSFSTIAGLIVLITLDVLLIDRYNIIGAAIASDVSYLVSLCAIVFYYLRNTNQRITDLIPGRRDLVYILNSLKTKKRKVV